MEAWILLVASLWGLCSANSVEQKIYINLNTTAPCVRLMNSTHQIGCQSSLTGDTGVIHLVQQESDLPWVLQHGPHPPYTVLLETDMFKRDIMLRLKVTGRVAGVAVVIPARPAAKQFSPDQKCPNNRYGVYSEAYGPEFANCNRTLWNPEGNDLSYEDFPFPIFMLRNKNETQVIRQCYLDHNVPVNGTPPDYPLCAMQLSSHMHGVRDTATCMRRSTALLAVTLNPEVVCDPLGDFNIWAVTQPINKSAKAPPEARVVMAATRLDARSFFWGVAPGADSAVSGFVALLAAAEALAHTPDVQNLQKNIMFVFFQGETFDYIGSSRMVYDMKKGNFPIQLQNIDTFLELNQVGRSSDIWAHTDPVSLQNNTALQKVPTRLSSLSPSTHPPSRLKPTESPVSVSGLRLRLRLRLPSPVSCFRLFLSFPQPSDGQVQSLLQSLSNATSGTKVRVQEPGQSQPLPPSSFQRFLRAADIPGAVLTDHRSSFTNSYYQSAYDLRENIGLEYPDDLPPEKALNYITDTARALADVGTVLARALYLEAGGNEVLENITASPLTVSRMLYTFLLQQNNSWMRSLISEDMKNIVGKEEMMLYVSASIHINHPTLFVQHILANLTGSLTNLTEEECRSADKRPADDKDFYDFLWIQGWEGANDTEPSPYCLRSAVWLDKAVSPAFELQDWASSEYSTWTESRWKGISARIFLVASRKLEVITLLTGIGVLLASLVLIYFVNAKASILFTSPREHSTVAY